MKSMTADELKAAFGRIEQRLKYLRRLLVNAEWQQSTQAAQFIRSHIWGIEFAMEELRPVPSREGGIPIIFESDGLGRQYITIGDVKYPVELDETLSLGEWYIRGRADDTR